MDMNIGNDTGLGLYWAGGGLVPSNFHHSPSYED